jgi:hypothetical protein
MLISTSDQNMAANASMPSAPRRRTGGTERRDFLPRRFPSRPRFSLASDFVLLDEGSAGTEDRRKSKEEIGDRIFYAPPLEPMSAERDWNVRGWRFPCAIGFFLVGSLLEPCRRRGRTISMAPAVFTKATRQGTARYLAAPGHHRPDFVIQ